jgi:hypothetical protein
MEHNINTIGAISFFISGWKQIAIGVCVFFLGFLCVFAFCCFHCGYGAWSANSEFEKRLHYVTGYVE